MKSSSVTTGPTKDFFISMITRDISLTDAIIELLDNSLDAAKKYCEEDNFTGLKIEINFSKDSFTIKDNCGGISIKDAKDYVFHFGRPKNIPKNEREVTGAFGIGMKRALFKMGREFFIESVTDNTKFTLSLDVTKWSDENINWDFPIEEEEIKQIANEIGTTIVVRNLYEGIATDFSSQVFITGLNTKIQQRASFEIEKMICITVNNILIIPAYMKIINSEVIKPIKKFLTLSNVDITLVAGIANKTNPDDAGWYIYCNNRLIIAADKSPLTTWNDESNVKFHSDFAAFRGFVFFNSKDPEKLPWNTSKTGIDTSSNVYISTKQIMVEVFKVIAAELRKLKRMDEDDSFAIEKELESESTVAINIGTVLSEIVINNTFDIIDKVRVVPNPNPLQRITYYEHKEDIQIMKKALRVTTNKEVGEITFKYYKDMECD